jgi:hypothetical protein
VCKAYIEASITGGELPFPNGSSVIPSDLATDEKIRAAHAQGRSVAIVDEHENVTILPSPDPALGEREWDRFWRGILTHWDSDSI